MLKCISRVILVGKEHFTSTTLGQVLMMSSPSHRGKMPEMRRMTRT